MIRLVRSSLLTCISSLQEFPRWPNLIHFTKPATMIDYSEGHTYFDLLKVRQHLSELTLNYLRFRLVHAPGFSPASSKILSAYSPHTCLPDVPHAHRHEMYDGRPTSEA